MSNHLGNGLATISDRGELQSAQDYYPFGMAMPGRSSGAYRYGFNGKETDPETGIQDYGMRWYLPNIARFPSVDPLAGDYPWYTPYQFAGNTPIQAIDLDGAEPTYPQMPREAITTIVTACYVIGQSVLVSPSGNLISDFVVFRYHKGSKGTFDNAAIWRLRQFFFVNREVKKRMPAQADYKDIGYVGLAPYNCITSVIEATALLFDIPESQVPRPTDPNRTVPNWLDRMHEAGMASQPVTLQFADERGAIKNGTRMPKQYADLSLSAALSKLSKETGGAENNHVFGVSLMDGWHSIMISMDQDGKFYLHDQAIWGCSEKGLTAKELDATILKVCQDQHNREKEGKKSSLALKIAEIKKTKKSEKTAKGKKNN